MLSSDLSSVELTSQHMEDQEGKQAALFPGD